MEFLILYFHCGILPSSCLRAFVVKELFQFDTGISRTTSRGFVSADAFESGLVHESAGGPAAVFDFDDDLGFDPLRGRARAAPSAWGERERRRD